VPVPETMRAARVHATGSPDVADVRLETVPTPRPGPGEVLVRVQACGVGPGDLSLVRGELPDEPALPLVLGREAAGVVEAVGERAEGWQPGDRVAIAAAQPCGGCALCAAGRANLCVSLRVLGVDADGAQAEFVVAAAGTLSPVPPEVSIEEAAIVTDTVATPYHALKRGGVGEGVATSVHGLDGVGLHAVLLAKLTGAHVIGVDGDEHRRRRALDWGADAVVDPSDGQAEHRVREVSEGGVDRSFVFSGSPAVVDEAVRSLRPGGRATTAGAGRGALDTVAIGRLAAQELEVVGASVPTPEDVGELLDLLDAGRLDLSRSVTDRGALDEIVDLLRRLETDEGHPVAIVTLHD
jgi:2-desacetyl-2-hydroxyethyl bacteriochlorophyllide A dehydrogenase